MRGRFGLKRMVRDQAGVSAVEFALILPFLVVIMTGVTDVGRLAAMQMQVSAASRAGASQVLTKGEFNSTNITNAMNAATRAPITVATPFWQYGCPNATTGVTLNQTATTTCASGTTAGRYARMSASASYSFLFTWPGVANPMTLSSTSTVRF